MAFVGTSGSATKLKMALLFVQSERDFNEEKFVGIRRSLKKPPRRSFVVPASQNTFITPSLHAASKSLKTFSACDIAAGNPRLSCSSFRFISERESQWAI